MVRPQPTQRYYLVGGGIAALAAAVTLIREAGVPGQAIRILDDRPQPGGALDGSGDAENGFLTRGGRMFEPYFLNTLDLLAGIPSADDPQLSVRDEILAFNARVPGSSNCRLIAGGGKADMQHLGLTWRDIGALQRLMLTPEARLPSRRISEVFARGFFDSNFWVMWSTMFSFQPWHSAAEMRRYLRRFIHLFPGFTRIKGILRTPYNQYDSLILPIMAWLRAQGVRLSSGTTVSGLGLADRNGRQEVTALSLADGSEIAVAALDRVLITLGSMTDGATYGSRAQAPSLTPGPCPSWDLWRHLAARLDGFGRPLVFADDRQRTGWTSFTVTMDGTGFRDHLARFTGNRTGTGGLITIRDSPWILSFVMVHQPHFRAQPDDMTVFWGYGLRGDRPGRFVDTPMWQATGDEILTELCGHLRLDDTQRRWFDGARVIPCHMPYITSQFMPRSPGDRPGTRPPEAGNFALMGQFVELPHDTVFTVEYSVRSARAAVAALTGKGAPIPVARTDRNPTALWRAARVLLRG